MKSKHFKTEKDMLDCINGDEAPGSILFEGFKGIVKDHTNGDWIIFYLEF